MTNEQYVRELPTSELRALIAAGLRGNSAGEVRDFARSMGISVVELRELVAPTVPSPEQIREMLDRVAVSKDETALRKLGYRAEDWRRNAAEAGDATAEWWIADLLKSIERRCAALRPAPAPLRCPMPPAEPSWVSPTVEPPARLVPGNGVDLGERRSGPRRGDDPVPRGDGLAWPERR